MTYQQDREIEVAEAKAKEHAAVQRTTKLAIRVGVGLLALLVLSIGGCKAVNPQLKRYQIETERKALISQAKSKRDAAVFEAQAEVERAKGVAEAQRVIGETLTPEYTAWLYVSQMPDLDGALIYVPTEGGIPVLEAGRGVAVATADGVEGGQ